MSFFATVASGDPPVYHQYRYSVGDPTDTATVPLLMYPQSESHTILKIGAAYELSPTGGATHFTLKFPISVDFRKEAERMFNSTILIDLNAGFPACKADITGSLQFIQDTPMRDNNGWPEVSDLYLDYAQTHPVHQNDSLPWRQGRSVFQPRNIIWTYGSDCEIFEVELAIRIPVIQYKIRVNGWYSFLYGWTTYIALALPMFVICRRIIEWFMRSNLIPVGRKELAEPNHVGQTKFNR